MTNERLHLEKKIREELIKQLFIKRDKLGLTQNDVALLLGKSENTYQRWESTGTGLTNIFDILTLFQILEFSTTEIIDVLGLPSLTLNDIKATCQNTDTLKSIKEEGIYSYVRKNCSDMEKITIVKLLGVLCDEYIKQHC